MTNSAVERETATARSVNGINSSSTTCWNQGVAQIGANKAGLFNYLIPVFTVGLAVALLGEVVHAYHAAGAVLTVIGIYLTTAARRPAPG